LLWTPPAETLEFVYGTPVSDKLLCARAVSQLDTSVPGTFAYSINGSKIEENQILDCGNHIVRCEFTPDVLANFNTCATSITIFVTRMTPTLTWEAPPPLMYPSFIDQEKHLNCVCSNPGVTGKMKYSVKHGDVLDVGHRQLFARFEPDDIINYYSQDSTVVITVVKGAPIICAWPMKIQHSYPSPLTASEHLNAESDVDNCRFEYNIEEGTVLSVGEHVISVKCTALNPDGTDSGNYFPTSACKTLTVLPTTCRIEWDGPAPLVKQYVIKYGTPLTEQILCAQLIMEEVRVSDQASLLAKAHDVTALQEQIQMLHPERDAEKIETLQKKVSYLNNQTVGFTYKPPLGTVLPGGKHKITCTYIPPVQCRNIKSSNKVSMTVVVERSLPKFSWPKLKDIVYGAALTEEQLCAEIAGNPLFSAGNFVYKHPLGSLLRVGLTMLEVKFVPFDLHSLYAVTMQNPLVVRKAQVYIRWDNAPSVVPLKYRIKASDCCAKCVGVDGKQLEGTFVYTPAVGQLVGAMGMRELSVVFNLKGESNKCYLMPPSLTVACNVVPPDSSSTGVATYLNK
jgi:hypothetical protein